MKTLDDEIKFQLAKSGWYVGETEIELGFSSIEGVDVEIAYLDGGHVACYQNGKIFISQALARFATLPQRRLAILHELAHSKFKLDDVSPHEKEYTCDLWALKEMVKSGAYNLMELYDAINLFGAIIDQPAGDTHPSSKRRHSRLYVFLKEHVS